MNKYMVLQFFHSKVSSGFLRQDSQNSYSFGIQDRRCRRRRTFRRIYIYIYSNVIIYIYANVITCARLCLKQMWRLMKANTKMKREDWTKRWNWSSCTKLGLRASLTHSLIAQSLRVSVHIVCKISELRVFNYNIGA